MPNSTQSTRMIWIMVIAGIALIAVLYFLSIPADEPGVMRSQFKIPDTKKSVYMVSRLSGQNEVLVLSTAKTDEYNPDEDIRYEGASPVFLYMEGDTLQVVTGDTAVIPAAFRETIPVRQIELSAPDMEQLLATYRERGYTRVDQP